MSLGAPTPASYTQATYFGVHAFWFTDPDGKRTKVRYRWEPDSGEEALSDEDAAARAPDYLTTDLTERLSNGEASFTLHLIVGADLDDETDPTTEWPADRDEVVAGRLVLTGRPDDPQDIEELMFDPTRVTSGIACRDDEILHAHTAAYGASYQRRTT